MPTTPTPSSPSGKLRILLIWASADFSTNDVSQGYLDAFTYLGHEVKVFRLNKRLDFWSEALGMWCAREGLPTPDITTIIREASLWSILEAAQFRPDLILITSGMGFHPDALRHLQDFGFTTALLLTECPYDDLHHISLAPYVTFVFANDLSSLDTLRPHNPLTFYLPTAYSSFTHLLRDPLPPNHEVDVLFIGTGFPERQEFLEAAVTSSFWPAHATFDLYGFWGWRSGSTPNTIEPTSDPGSWPSPLAPYLRGPVPNSTTPSLIASSRITVNLYRSGSHYSLNPRAYEIAAVGGFQLAQDSSLEAHLVFGDTIAYFSTPDELAQQVARYLSPLHTPERVRMARESRERILGTHSYLARAQDLLGHVSSIQQALADIESGLPLPLIQAAKPVQFGGPFPDLGPSPSP